MQSDSGSEGVTEADDTVHNEEDMQKIVREVRGSALENSVNVTTFDKFECELRLVIDWYKCLHNTQRLLPSRYSIHGSHKINIALLRLCINVDSVHFNLQKFANPNNCIALFDLRYIAQLNHIFQGWEFMNNFISPTPYLEF
jgi:hypothetical protein